MGITKELKETYEYYKFLDKCSLNNIISEDICDYVDMYLLKEEKEDIIREFGSIKSFSNVMAENFTRNGGNFVLTEGNISENPGVKVAFQAGKRFLGTLFKRGVSKASVKTATRVGRSVISRSISKRFGAEATKIAAYAGKKTIAKLSYTDIAKYVTRDMVKGANSTVRKQLERQAALLAKHTEMDAKLMKEFMEKYACGPTGCDAKLWNKAFLNTGKKYYNGVKFTDDLVINEYNVLARQAGKATIGTTAGHAIGGGLGTEVGGRLGGRAGAASGAAGGAAGSLAGSTAGSFAGKAARFLMKAPIVLARGTGKILKKVGLFCLRHPIKAAIGAVIIYEGWKWIKGEDGLFRRIQRIIDFFRTGNDGGYGGYASSSAGSLDAVYPKIYGDKYIGEDPEDYRLI